MALREVAQMTFKEYTEQRYIECRPLKRSTRENYELKLRVHVFPLIGAVPLKALTPQRLRQVYVHLARAGLADSYVRNIWLVLAGICKQAADEDRMWDGRSPAKGIRPRTSAGTFTEPLDEDDIPTNDECWAIIDAASERYKRLIRVAMLTGLRMQELCGLCPDAVHPDRNRLYVCRQLADPNNGVPYFSRPKNNRARWVEQVPAEVFTLLAEQQSKFPAPAPIRRIEAEHPDAAPPSGSVPIFINRHGQPVQRSHLGITYANTTERAGLKRRTPQARFHALRHVYVSALIDAGYPVTAVMRWVGHEDANETLRTYARLFDAATDTVSARADAFNARLARPARLRAV
jgi:integrase